MPLRTPASHRASPFARVAHLAWEAGRALLALQVGLATTGALLPLAIGWTTKGIFDGATARDAPRTIHWLGVELVVATLILFVARATVVVRSRVARRLVALLSERISRTAATVPLRAVETPVFHDDHERASKDTFTRPLGVVTESLNLLQNAIAFAAAAIVLVRFGAWVLAITTGVAILTSSVQRNLKVARMRLVNSQAAPRRRLAHLEEVLTSRRYAKDIRAYGIASRFVRAYRDGIDALNRQEDALDASCARKAVGVDLAGSAALYVPYGIVAAGAIAGGMTIGDLSLYLITFRLVHQSFFGGINAVAEIREHQAYLDNVFRFLCVYRAEAARSRAPQVGGIARVELEGVAFRYDGCDDWAIRDATLVLRGGELVAIVGSNGAGKTTLVKLLLGLYAPTHGAVRVGSVDTSMLSAEERAATFAVAFQDPAPFFVTVREAISVSAHRALDDAACLRALAHAGEPMATASFLDTQLGPIFDGGVDLSGGQWQKLALARALAQDAPVLVLDEPTRELDSASKEGLLAHLVAMARSGRSVIVVTHDEELMAAADRVVELRDGTLRNATSRVLEAS